MTERTRSSLRGALKLLQDDRQAMPVDERRSLVSSLADTILRQDADGDSVVADPGFLPGGEFAFAPESPIHALGIRPVDVSRAGPPGAE